MTPAKVKSVVDASLVGGVTYQGTFDASSPADLSNASKGDLYIISVAGTYAGKTWAVGDHLLVNADMGGTLDSSKIDKVDNTDAVTSVAGRTGAITLSTSDISGLATVASTGAYSDLSGTPTLGTAAVEDVGTSAGNVVQLDGSARLPAVDGSQLINLPSGASALGDLTDVTITAASTGEVLRYDGAEWVDAQLAYSDLSGTPTLATVATTGAYSDLSGTPTNVSTFTNDAGYLTDITAENLGDLADVDLTGLADGEIIIYNATSGKWEANPPPAPLATTTSVGLIEIAENAEATAGTATDKALVPSNISSITTAQLDNSAGTMLESANNLSELTNAATARTNLGLATVASTGAYSDLSGTPTLGTAAALDVGTSANNVVQLNGSAQLPAVDGSLLTGVVADISGASVGDLSDVTITAASTGEVLRYNGAEWVDAQLAYSDLSGTPTLGTAAAEDVGTSAGNVVQLDGSARLPAVDGSQLTNLPGGDAFYTTTVSSTSTAAQISDNRHQTYRVSQSGITLTLQNASGGVTTSPAIGGIITLINTSSGSVTIASPAGGLGPFYVLASGSVQSFTLEAGARISFVWISGNSLVERAVSTLNGLSDVTITAASTGEVLRYDGAEWVDAQLAYSDLSGTPTLGTAAALDVGTSANNVVQLNGSAQLPAVDGSLLTGVVADISGASIGDLTDVTITAASTGEVLRYDGAAWVDAQLSLGDLSDVDLTQAPTDNQTLFYDENAGTFKAGSVPPPAVITNTTTAITTYTGNEEAHVITPTADSSVTLPDASLCGAGYKYYIKNMSTFTLSVTPTNGLIDGLSYFDLSSQYSAITIFTDGTDWYIF